MSTYHGAPPAVGYPRPAAPTRPVTAALAMWSGLLVGLLTLAAAVIAITTGKSSLRDYAIDEATSVLGDDADPEFLELTVQAAIDEAYGTLVVKAGIALVMAVVVLAFALTVINAALWGRICLTVALTINLCAGSGLLLIETDVMPAATVAAAAIAPLLSIVAIVLMWLPANNRYAAARKLAR